MTPEARAARDRLARFAEPGFPMPVLNLPADMRLTPAEVKATVDEIMRGVHETLAPDLKAVLAVLDRHDDCGRP